MADPLFTPEARLMLEREDRAGMKTFCETLHPATVAETLTDTFKVEDVWRFLRCTTIDHQAAIFAYFPVEMQLEMVQGTGREQIANLIEEMSSDDRTDLLRRLPAQVRDSLLRLVDEADRKDIAHLIQYPENTAGALMTTDYAWLPGNISVEQALDRLRLQAPDKETIYYVYIVDEQRRLRGVISLRDLIMASRRAILSDQMESNIVSVRDSDDREHVAHVFAEYDLIAMPVIDADGKLVGIITSDDVVDVVVSEATEDVHRMGAVGPLAEDYLQTPFFALWRNRVFWLGVLLFGQTFTIEAMAYYEDNLKVMAVLAIFVPLCLSTGGNSGSQASTLINRAMSLGQIQIGDWFKATRHELLMGVALGLSLALLAAARTWWFTKPEWLLNPDDRPPTDLTRLTFVISLAIFALCVSGTLIGTLLPLLFKRLGADPAVASTPFVATFADVTGIVIYFSVARLIFGAALG